MRPFWLLILPLVGACNACGTRPASSDAGDAAPDIAAIPDARPDVPPCTPSPRPSYVPDGWIPYDDFAPCSGLYVPTDASQLPPPIAWEDCSVPSGVAGCRRVHVDWSPVPTQMFLDVDVAVDKQGNAVAITSRDYGNANGKLDHRFDLVAAVDGPVYSAILSTVPSIYTTTTYIPPAFAPPRWIMRILVSDYYPNGGYIAGTTSSVAPTSFGRFTDNRDHSEIVGAIGILDISNNAAISLRAFDSGTQLLSISTPSLPMSFESTFDSVVFWQGDSWRVADVGRWDMDAGAVDFINYGFDPNHSAGCLGTDGKDMVWMEGHGPETDAAFWSSADYWTSPYATNSSQLQPRRLRSAAPNSVGNTRIAVGCGYAFAIDYGVMKIIRISDGSAWLFPNAANPYKWAWVQALAINCKEAFVEIQEGWVGTMARLDLGQLGAPVPAD